MAFNKNPYCSPHRFHQNCLLRFQPGGPLTMEINKQQQRETKKNENKIPGIHCWAINPTQGCYGYSYLLPSFPQLAPFNRPISFSPNLSRNFTTGRIKRPINWQHKTTKGKTRKSNLRNTSTGISLLCRHWRENCFGFKFWPFTPLHQAWIMCVGLAYLSATFFFSLNLLAFNLFSS